jgi:hypothetical protein
MQETASASPMGHGSPQTWEMVEDESGLILRARQWPAAMLWATLSLVFIGSLFIAWGMHAWWLSPVVVLWTAGGMWAIKAMVGRDAERGPYMRIDKSSGDVEFPRIRLTAKKQDLDCIEVVRGRPGAEDEDVEEIVLVLRKGPSTRVRVVASSARDSELNEVADKIGKVLGVPVNRRDLPRSWLGKIVAWEIPLGKRKQKQEQDKA